jgi:DNA polymerase (family 10)
MTVRNTDIADIFERMADWLEIEGENPFKIGAYRNAIRRIGRQRGLKINERDPYEVDMAAVVHKAKERGCCLKLNANPQRLDLTDACCRMAKEAGVLVAIDTDAHSTSEFGQLHYGIGQARRGWLEKKDVLNTRTLDELLKLLKRTMG